MTTGCSLMGFLYLQSKYKRTLLNLVHTLCNRKRKLPLNPIHKDGCDTSDFHSAIGLITYIEWTASVAIDPTD